MKSSRFDPARPHLWRGEWLDDAALDAQLATLAADLHADLSRPSPLEALLRAAEALSRRLREDPALAAELTAVLREDPAVDAAEAREMLATLAEHLSGEALRTKLRRELGSLRPQVARRIDYLNDTFEAWAPLGLLVHVAPGNVPTVAPLSVIEGLLAGNLNILKTSSQVPPFAQRLLAELIALDPSGTLAPFISVLAVPSQQIERLKPVFALADGIAVWGGESAVAAIAGLAPSGCRVVDWGHKISFAYLAAECLADEATLEQAARDVCLIEQQACSSPQCLYVEVPDRAALFAFAERFAVVLARISADMPRAAGAEPARQEWADISTAGMMAELESAWSGTTRVFTAPDRSWRVFAEDHPALRASPLFRTIWIKPLPPERIVDVLRPMRRWLQTVGLAAPVERVAELASHLVAAGVTRVARIGEQLGGYAGEPHDGVYALTRYSRRVGLELPAALRGVTSFDELIERPSPLRPGTPILDKAGFLALAPDPRHAHLFVRSGGSSGVPKTSVFSWADYDAQMRASADGLYAAGLDPRTDRAINLFFAGHMYGGFLSFFSILERLGAAQLPMAGIDDLAAVAKEIVHHRANVVLGMPFYLQRLFSDQAELLREYGGIDKVFFGGEHMSATLRRRLREEFGVKTIRAAAYGSNDAGPMGYQCPHCEDSVYHVLSQIQHLEILDLEQDRPAPPDQPGRLVVRSFDRESLPLERYEIGDLGRWIEQPCPCGRRAPRFELLGRHGDLFRAAGFYSYGRFVRTLDEQADYSGPLQIEISDDGWLVRVKVRLLAGSAPPAERARELLLAHDPDLREGTGGPNPEIALDVEVVPLERFVTVPATGKLKSIIDLRESA